MQKVVITKNSKETQKLGEDLAKKLKGGEIICLSGDLGSGKTTFTQGLLKGLKLKGPFTSPTFLIMKKYAPCLKAKSYNLKAIYHVDAYRVNAKDVLDLGWEEIIADNPPAGGNIVIIEWAEKIRDIIPEGAKWIRFEFISEKEREIILKN
jgi:tRNA threonylcarbamoyladenosine biosynthesis protein TsaE